MSERVKLSVGETYLIKSRGDIAVDLELNDHTGLTMIRTSGLSEGVDTALTFYEGENDDPLSYNDDLNGSVAAQLDSVVLFSDQSYRLNVANIASNDGWFELELVEIEPDDSRWSTAVERALQRLSTGKQDGSSSMSDQFDQMIAWVREVNPDYADQALERAESSLNLEVLSNTRSSQVPQLVVGQIYNVVANGEHSVTFDIQSDGGVVGVRTSNLSDEVDTTLALQKAGADSPVKEDDDSGEGYASQIEGIFIVPGEQYQVTVANINNSEGWFSLEVFKIDEDDDFWEASVLQSLIGSTGSNSSRAVAAKDSILGYLEEVNPEYAASLTEELHFSRPWRYIRFV